MVNSQKSPLRPCEFTLEGHDTLGFAKLGSSDYTNDAERAEATRNRKVFFHTWGTDLQPKTEEGKILSVGIVEDAEDGKVYMVYPENIQFTDQTH